MLTVCVLATALATAPVPEPEPEQEPEAQSSLELRSAGELWATPGFRIDIGYAFVALAGMGEAPDLLLHGVSLRPGLRLSEEWLLYVALVYAFDPQQGINWAVTLEPTWNPWAGLTVSVGFGYAGLIRTESPPVNPNEPWEPTVGFDRDTKAFAYSCDGDGAVATVGVSYSFSVFSIFGTGPFARGVGMLTSCSVPAGDFNAETGQRSAERHNWMHFGGQLGWWISWR